MYLHGYFPAEICSFSREFVMCIPLPLGVPRRGAVRFHARLFQAALPTKVFYHRLSVQHQILPLILDGGTEGIDLLFRADGSDLHLGGHLIPNIDRFQKFHTLGEVNRPGSGQVHADHPGDQAARRKAMADGRVKGMMVSCVRIQDMTAAREFMSYAVIILLKQTLWSMKRFFIAYPNHSCSMIQSYTSSR